MRGFFTSSLSQEESKDFNPKNDFVKRLKETLKSPAVVTYIASDPESYEITDSYAYPLFDSLRHIDVELLDAHVLDERTKERAKEFVQSSDILILAGGYVPTEHAFFQSIDLKKLLEGFDGVILATSAGSMNSAKIVYNQPEYEDDLDQTERFFKGLGLIESNILPHYHEAKGTVLKGLRLYEDITLKDSLGKRFYALPDGSYIEAFDGREILRGESYLITDGKMEQLLSDGESLNVTEYRFDARIEEATKGGAYVVFPWNVREEFQKGRVKVHATFDGIPYDGSVVNMGLKDEKGEVQYLLGILKAIREELKKGVGDIVHVTVRERT
ncbi:DUF1905 domain-containing protein [Guggenheimella bovis]